MAITRLCCVVVVVAVAVAIHLPLSPHRCVCVVHEHKCTLLLSSLGFSHVDIAVNVIVENLLNTLKAKTDFGVDDQN